MAHTGQRQHTFQQVHGRYARYRYCSKERKTSSRAKGANRNERTLKTTSKVERKLNIVIAYTKASESFPKPLSQVRKASRGDVKLPRQPTTLLHLYPTIFSTKLFSSKPQRKYFRTSQFSAKLVEVCTQERGIPCLRTCAYEVEEGQLFPILVLTY